MISILKHLFKFKRLNLLEFQITNHYKYHFMKKDNIFFLAAICSILFVIIFITIEHTNEPNTSSYINDHTLPPTNPSDVTSTSTKINNNCNSYAVSMAVQKYLLNTGIIQFKQEININETIKLNDNCDYKVKVTFYLKDLINGDGYKTYRVGYDGNDYFVY